MGAGFQAFDQNNNIQFDGDTLTYFLRKSGYVYSASDNTTNYLRVPGASSYPNALVGFFGGGGHIIGFSLNGAYAGLDYWEYVTTAPSNVPFGYCIFERSDSIPSAGFGLELRNSASQVTFSAAQRPLRSLDYITYPTGNTASSRPSKTLGWIPLAWGGYNRYDDAEEQGSYYHDFSVYAAGNIGGNIHYVSADTIEVPGGRGIVFGNRPPDQNQFEVPGNFIIFNAANVPIGGPFF